ncbi:MAG: TIGR03016 family PEP-CTERM system-associated outer membrane protein, partial [Thauera sp.]
NDELDDYERVKTRAFSLSLDHKLSGLASLRLAALRSKSEGEGVDDDETTRTAYTVGLTRRLGAQASGSLTYRHIKSEGDDPYTENAVTATLGMRF